MTIGFIAAGVGNSRNGTGVRDFAYPAGTSTDDLLVLWLGGKPDTYTYTISDTDWTQQLLATGGTGANAVDAGAVRMAIETKVDNDADTNASSSLTNPGPAVGIVLGFDKTLAGAWDLAATSGSDATTGTGGAAGNLTADMAANIDIASGDYVVGLVSSPTDGAAFTAPAITVPGCTVGTVVVLAAVFGTTLNTDASVYAIGAPISAGSSSGVGTITITSSTAEGALGGLALLRLREPALPDRPWTRQGRALQAVGRASSY